MMIHKISIGPAPAACFQQQQSYAPPGPLSNEVVRSHSLHLANSRRIEQGDSLAANADQLVAFHLGDGIGDSLSIHAEPVSHLLMRIALHFLAAARKPEQQRSYARRYRLERG